MSYKNRPYYNKVAGPTETQGKENEILTTDILTYSLTYLPYSFGESRGDWRPFHA